MLSQISLAIPIGKAIADIGCAMVQERDRQKLAALQIDLTGKIIDLQTKLLEIQSAVILEREAMLRAQKRLCELESHEREKARYQLAKLGTVGNFFAYRLRPQCERLEEVAQPDHFVCQLCFDDGKISVLLVGDDLAVCPRCKTEIPLHAGRRRTVLSRRIAK